MAGTLGRSGGNRHGEIDAFPSDGQPVPPAGRTVAFNRHWRFLLCHIPTHALRKIDGVQLSILAEQLTEIEQLNAMVEANPSDLKARSLRLRICQQVSRLSAQFGLSPSDRMRLKLQPPDDEDDPFNELLSRLQSSHNS